MNNSYRNLLLTTSLILMSLNTNALSHKDLVDESFEMFHSRSLSKGVEAKIAPASDEDKVSENDTGSTSYQEQVLKEEESELKDSQVISNSRNVSEIASSDGIAIPQENLFVPAKLGKIHITYKDSEFYLTKDNSQKFQIQRWNLSKELRGIKEEELRRFLTAGYFSISQLDDESYTLAAKLRLRGGGPILGTIGYWTVKSVGYTVAALWAVGGPCGTATAMAGAPSLVAATETAATAVGVALGMTPSP